MATTAPNSLRRQAEATALANLAGPGLESLSTVGARRLAADARDLVALVRVILRLHRRWHAQSYSPLVHLLLTTARHVESTQGERDRAAKARARKHLLLLPGGKAASRRAR